MIIAKYFFRCYKSSDIDITSIVSDLNGFSNYTAEELVSAIKDERDKMKKIVELMCGEIFSLDRIEIKEC